ncbi:MAG: PPOX class F420-dependent oxidoreductase [Pseudomonadota bacterium]
MRPFSREECLQFISEGCKTGKVATVRKDGRPHVAPIWFILDGEVLVFTTHEDTLKGRTLKRDPRAMLSVDNEVFPFDFVLVEGVATLERLLPRSLVRWTAKIAARYVPKEYVESTAERNAVDGELLVRLEISKMTGMADVAS